MRPTQWFLLFALIASVLVACRDGDGRIEFSYTPVPVYELPDGTRFSLNERGTRYVADQVIVLAQENDLTRLEEWLDEVGFTILRKTDLTTREGGQEKVRLLVKVPEGSVIEAALLIQQAPGVEIAEPNGLFQPEDELLRR